MSICGNCFKETETALCPFCGFDGDADAGRDPQALPGGTLQAGTYLVGRVLCRKSSFFAYAAYDNLRERQVELREFFPSSAVRLENGRRVDGGPSEEDFLRGKGAFLQEAQEMARHSDLPNAVSVCGCFEENNTAYAVLERVSGESLGSFLARVGGRIPPNSAKAILQPVIEALSAARACGLRHGDLTIDDITLLPDSSVKLLCFLPGERDLTPDGGEEGLDEAGEVRALAEIFRRAVAGGKTSASSGGQGVRLAAWEEEALVKAREGRCQSLEDFRAALWEAPRRPRLVTVTWKNPDGSIIDTSAVPYGEVPSHEAPFRPSDGRNSFTFSQWYPQPSAVTGDVTYTATYDVRPLPPRPGEEAQNSRPRVGSEDGEPWPRGASEDRESKPRGASAPARTPSRRPSPGSSEPTRVVPVIPSPDPQKLRKASKPGRTRRRVPLALIIAIPVVCCALIALGILLLRGRNAGPSGGDPALSATASPPAITEVPAATATAAPSPDIETPGPSPTPVVIPSASSAPGEAATLVLNYGRLQYQLAEDGSAVIVGWNGQDAEVVIPSEVAGIPVSAIGEKAFFNDRNITDVTIPQGVVSIGPYAFFNCAGLETVRLPDTVAVIEEYAFDRCRSLTGVEYPGAPEQWAAISVETGNQPLTDAEFRFGPEGETEQGTPDAQWIYCITATAGSGGSISPGGVLWFPEDGSRSQTYTIAADPGCRISDVLVDGVSVGAVSSYTFPGISASHVIEARFSGGGGSGGSGSGGSGDGSSTYDDGRVQLELGGRTFYSDDTTLNLQGLGITDISVLAKCTNLKNLNLNNNCISDLTPLKGLTTLTTLQLNNNNITDLSPLAGLTNLEKLYLLGNTISDWSPVSFVPVVQGRPNN